MTRFIVFMLSVLSLLAGLGGFVTAVQGEQTAVPISQQELLRYMASPVDQLILDVRTPMEFRAGHVPGAINIPYTDLLRRLDEVRLYQDKEVVVYCETGIRAGVAEKILGDVGFSRLRHLEGDMALWRHNQLPLETPPPGQ